MAAPEPAAAGSAAVLGGRYRLDQQIGAGGMGEVWRATDLVLGRTVAVKIMLPQLVSDPEFSRRFFAEAKAMASVNHASVVAIHDFGTDAGIAYLVMAYIEGESLSRTLARVGRLSAPQTMTLIAQAAAALQAVHDAGIVHRDIKPGNLLVRPDGSVVLTDFGIARSQTGTSLTTTGGVLGTPSYLAPEQVLGGRATFRSDIYSLGLVAYECLAGRRPFEADNPFAVALKRVQEAPQTLGVDASVEVLLVVERSLATDPEDRWASATDLAIAAQQAAVPQASNGPMTPYRASPVARPLAESGRRRPTEPGTAPHSIGNGPRRNVLVAVLVAAALTVGVGAWALGRYGRVPDQLWAQPVDGFVTCGSGLCPAAPMCWGGLLALGGVAQKPREIECAKSHSWETFVAAYLPAGAVDVRQDELMDRADISAICSNSVMSARSVDPAATGGWTVEPWPIKVTEQSWVLHCLAGPLGDGSAGSKFRSGH